MDWITNILAQAFGNTKRNVIIFALACADAWYVYNYSLDVTAQCILIFCVAWYVAVIAVNLWQWIAYCRRKKHNKEKEVRSKQFELAQERGQAEDVFERMTNDERRTLCYAILAGIKSHQYLGQYSYRHNTYTGFMLNIENACTPPDTFDSIVRFTQDNGKMTLSFFNTQLIDVAEEYIKNHNITKESIEAEIDAYIEECNKR